MLCYVVKFRTCPGKSIREESLLILVNSDGVVLNLSAIFAKLSLASTYNQAPWLLYQYKQESGLVHPRQAKETPSPQHFANTVNPILYTRGPFLQTPDNFLGPKTILGVQYSPIAIQFLLILKASF